MELGLRINFRVMVNQRDKFQNKIISGLIPISDVFFLQLNKFSSIPNVSSLENITPSFRRFGPKPWLLWRFFTSPFHPLTGWFTRLWANSYLQQVGIAYFCDRQSGCYLVWKAIILISWAHYDSQQRINAMRVPPWNL